MQSKQVPTEIQSEGAQVGIDAKKLAKENCAPEDVIEINVGGVLFTTTRATMTKYPDTMLGALFSGRHPVIDTDDDGRVFLDRNPTYFRYILEWLRSNRLPPIPAEEETAFGEEIDFYQLPSPFLPSESQVCRYRSLNSGCEE